MLVKYILIKNRLGLHARAAVKLSQLMSRFESDIVLSHHGKVVDGKSVMGILLLAATQGSIIEVRVSGPDEVAAVDAIASLIDGLFGESE